MDRMTPIQGEEKKAERCFHAFILKSAFLDHFGNPGLLRHAGPGPGGLRRDVQHHLTTQTAALLQSFGEGPGTCYQDSFLWKKKREKHS